MTARDEDLARLRELEAQGASFSRNREFALWEDPDNERVLALKRYLVRLADEIVRLSEAGRADVAVRPVDDQVVEVVLTIPDLSARHVARLSTEQLGYLRQDTRVSALL